MPIEYEKDMAAWSNEQAALLRAGQLSKIDVENLANEIEAVGFWFESELNERCAILLTYLARWCFQADNRCELWRREIDLQRKKTTNLLDSMPSLHYWIDDEGFLEDAWLDALLKTISENGCFTLPSVSPWTLSQALTPDFYPDHLPS